MTVEAFAFSNADGGVILHAGELARSVYQAISEVVDPDEHGGRVRTVRPDFVFFTEHDDGTIGAAIVDPHGHHLGDALPKLRELAGYVERHGQHFDRIDTVAKIGEKLRVLDLTEPSVRAAVASATDAASLYQGEHASDY